MRIVSTITICVIAQVIGAAASPPAGAEPGHGRRLAPHRPARHASPLTVRHHAKEPVEVTMGFDPVPPDPLVIGFFRGLEGYGADGAAYGPLDRAQPFGPRVFRDF